MQHLHFNVSIFVRVQKQGSLYCKTSADLFDKLRMVTVLRALFFSLVRAQLINK